MLFSITYFQKYEYPIESASHCVRVSSICLPSRAASLSLFDSALNLSISASLNGGSYFTAWRTDAA